MTNNDLKIHFHPQKGWINDPNGLSEFKGKYHIFFQHIENFETPWTAPVCWGHAVTTDFLHFTELPIAISPDEDYDAGGVWSGTCAERGEVLYAFYASVDGNKKQTISVATSTDGIYFSKYSKNPIIKTFPKDGSKDFRDPAILVMDSENFLVVASADTEKGTGNLLLYKSQNMFDWEYQGVLYEYADSMYCECPSFVKCNDKYLLSTSVVKKDGSHFFEVMFGDFNGKIFEPQIKSHFQKGPDEYAGQIFNDKSGRCIMMSWIPGWDYQPREKCIGCLSLPLEITVKENKIFAYPIKEVRHLIKGNSVIDGYVKETFKCGGKSVEIKLLSKPKK